MTRPALPTTTLAGATSLVLAAALLTGCSSDGADVLGGRTPTPHLSPSTAASEPEASTAAPVASAPAAVLPTSSVPASPSAPARPASPTPAPVLQPGDRLSLSAIGPVRVGMTYAEVERASGRKVEVSDDLDTGGSCVSVTLKGLPASQRVGFLGSDGSIRRIDVYDPSKRTTLSGVGLGDPVAKVKQVYGAKLTERPHPYGGDAYLTLHPKGSPYEVIFEIVDGKVQTFRSGFIDEVEYIEGCA